MEPTTKTTTKTAPTTTTTTAPAFDVMKLPEQPEYRVRIGYIGGEITGSTAYRFKDKETGQWVAVKAGFKATGLRSFEGRTTVPSDFIAALLESHANDPAFGKIFEAMVLGGRR